MVNGARHRSRTNPANIVPKVVPPRADVSVALAAQPAPSALHRSGGARMHGRPRDVRERGHFPRPLRREGGAVHRQDRRSRGDCRSDRSTIEEFRANSTDPGLRVREAPTTSRAGPTISTVPRSSMAGRHSSTRRTARRGFFTPADMKVGPLPTHREPVGSPARCPASRGWRRCARSAPCVTGYPGCPSVLTISIAVCRYSSRQCRGAASDPARSEDTP